MSKQRQEYFASAHIPFLMFSGAEVSQWPIQGSVAQRLPVGLGTTSGREILVMEQT